jgi:putative phosphoesterase
MIGMKWMIASDIHGSEIFCRELLHAYEKENADKLLLLGDILYHGPRNALPNGYAPKAVIELLNAKKEDILCVRGNCDAEVDQMVLDFPIMADYAIIHEGDLTIFATHGHIYNEKNLPKMKKGTVLLQGHTHIPACKVHEEYTCLNPGSVSIPKEDSHHGYMTLEDGLFLWKDLDGNVRSQILFGKES